MFVLELKIVFEFKLREYRSSPFPFEMKRLQFTVRISHGEHQWPNIEYRSGPQRNYIRKGKGLSL